MIKICPGDDYPKDESWRCDIVLSCDDEAWLSEKYKALCKCWKGVNLRRFNEGLEGLCFEFINRKSLPIPEHCDCVLKDGVFVFGRLFEEDGELKAFYDSFTKTIVKKVGSERERGELFSAVTLPDVYMGY